MTRDAKGSQAHEEALELTQTEMPVTAHIRWHTLKSRTMPRISMGLGCRKISMGLRCRKLYAGTAALESKPIIH